MIAVIRMLARGESRHERVRGRLMVAGAALATFLLCAAVNLLQAEGDRLGAILSGDGNDVTALGLALLIVPVAAFVYQMSRLTGAARERRLAALRLAGATPRHVRLLGAYEGARRASLGGLTGVTLYLAVNLALSWVLDGALPLVSFVALPAVLAAVTLGGALSGLSPGRHVVISPLGVTRGVGPAGPRVLDLVLVVAGVGTFVAGYGGKGGFPLGGKYGGALAVVAGAVLLLFGLVLATAGLIRAAARWVGRRTRAAETLLAARLMEADPRSWARALSVIGLTVFFSSVVGAQQAIVFSADVPGTASLLTTYLLVDLALVVALATSSAALVAHQVEQLLDHRRSFAALTASGVPAPALGRVLTRQALIAALPVCLVAALAGTGIAVLGAVDLYGERPGAIGWTMTRAALTVLIGALTALLVAAAARRLLRRTVRLDEFHTE
ncbi:hypothetical protein GCM10010517_47600 [Streptosporangium fragile]|uniref:FtsX-like permease family protein n=1 Tax=Streptosporangium fragile TaxID=46186 RepID=A0ABN3W334_9ACTN